jgi:DNA primase catalytic subunit
MSEERDCVVKFVDCHDVEHSVKVRAASVYEAALKRAGKIRKGRMGERRVAGQFGVG